MITTNHGCEKCLQFIYMKLNIKCIPPKDAKVKVIGKLFPDEKKVLEKKQ